MSKFKGTPGPWFWENNVLCNKDFIVGGNGHIFHSQANKDLIASAPDLLKALTKIMEVHGHMGDANVWSISKSKEGIAAREAIAKALGESK